MHYSPKHKDVYKNRVGGLRRERVAALKGLVVGGGSFETQQNVLRRNLMTVPLHCGQVVVLFKRWLKKANLFPVENS
jgi:hypothetical protein